MNGSSGEGADAQFADTLQLLVQHRGLSAEKALLDAFGEARLLELYDGQGPSFSEVTTIINVLQVPLNYFEQREPTALAEIEIAYGGLLYFLSQMDDAGRERFKREMQAMAMRAEDEINRREEEAHHDTLEKALGRGKT